MHLEFKELKDGFLERQYCCAPELFPVLKEIQEKEPWRFGQAIDIQLRFQKSGLLIEVDGLLKTRVGMECGLCLQPFEDEIQTEFALTFTPLATPLEADVDEEIELDADEMGLIYYQDDTLELLQPLQEQLIMALPISPVCAADCLGLCPECGCDLNKEICTCIKKPFSSKFSALAGLKIDPGKLET